MEKLEHTTQQVTPFIQAADNEKLINVYCLHIYPSDTIDDKERKMYEMELNRRWINIAKELSKRFTLEAQKKAYEELGILGIAQIKSTANEKLHTLLH